MQTRGIGDVIFGKSSPAGRTVQTVYPASYVDSISIFDMNMRPGPSAFPRPDCNCSRFCCGTRCMCRNTTGEPMRYCPCGSAGCSTPPISSNPPCLRGTNPGRTHRFYTGKAIVPFGYGLSYTTWAYTIVDTVGHAVVGAVSTAASTTGQAPPASVAVSLDRARAILAGMRAANESFARGPALDDEGRRAGGPLVGFLVNVTNTGPRDADDVVLGFLVPPGAGKGGVPLQSLFGFERVHVKAGGSATVYLYPQLLDFTQVDGTGRRRAWPGQYTVQFGVEADTRGRMGHAKATLVAL